MITKITVSKIDQSTLEEIKKAHAALKSSDDESKEIHLNINSVRGEKEISLQIAEVLLSDTSIIPVTNVTGNLDVAGTILTASGMVGKRTADPKSNFVINDGEAYGKDTKPEDLDGVDYAIYDALSSLTGKKFTILEKMKEGGVFSAVVAKKCGIVDEISGFKNAFRPKVSLKGRTRKKSAASTSETVATGNNTENFEEVTESQEAKPVTRTRRTSEKSESGSVVQRGRIK